MVTTKLNLSMTEPSVRQIYAKQGDTGRVLDISLDQTPEDGTLRILRPDGVEVTSEAVTGGEVESGETFESMTEADVTELTVGIEPVQDLNGFDKPWVGGAGKNLYDGSLIRFNADPSATSLNGITLAKNTDGSFRVRGTASAETRLNVNYTDSFAVASYAISVRGITGSGLRIIVQGNPSSAGIYYTSVYPTSDWSEVYSVTESSTLNYFYLDVQSGATIDFTLKVQIEKGSTATAWQPYSNICHITGHDEVRVYDDPVYGKTIKWNQLWTAPSLNDATKTEVDGVITITPKNYTTNSAGLFIRNMVYNHKVFLSAEVYPDGESDFTFEFGRAGISTVRNAPPNVWTRLTSVSMNSTRQDAVLSCNVYGRFGISGWSSGTFKVRNVFEVDLTEMFGEGNEPTIEEFEALFPKDYYPYNTGEETTVSAVNGDPNLQYTTSLGQTVYGGTLDMVTGQLVVDKVGFNPQSSIFNSITHYQSNFNSTNGIVSVRIANRYLSYLGIDTTVATLKAKTISTLAPVFSSGQAWNNTDAVGKMGVVDGLVFDYHYSTIGLNEWTTDGSTIVNAFYNTFGSSLFIVAPLATPQTYTLTPQQIKTLVGTNNVWASSGDIVNIKFAYGGLLSELPSDATEIVGKCYCDVEQNGVSSMPFTLNVKKNERES